MPLTLEEAYGPATAITAVTIQGFKSFADESRLEISPLTLLAGANSSGKSSALQPLLLLKQTLEVDYDPGPLRLSGPHVRFTSADQLLSKLPRGFNTEEFRVRLESDKGTFVEDTFRKKADESLDLVQMKLSQRRGSKKETFILASGMPEREIEEVGLLSSALFASLSHYYKGRLAWKITRRGPFLFVSVRINESEELIERPVIDQFIFLLRRIIHVPGLRGNPERTYRTSAVEGFFRGTFENYVASLLLAWQHKKDKRIDRLGDWLQALGLTGQVRANPLDATQVELVVGQLPKSKKDFVNIADVGFGVSQVLPVLVALLVAEPGQLVYLEQPELHLHPRAQQALASVLAEAANRGVQVVAETHSSILLLAVQTLVAEGKLSPDKVKLHWFQRDSRGATQVTSGALDRLGAYGDWPEDFGEVQAAAESEYLDAVESKVLKPKKNAKK